MKKFYKLLLIVVTIISLLSFVFYKTQYDKLYNVLQVLEIYGQPPSSSIPTDESSLKSCFNGDSSLRSIDPVPSWRRVSDSVYVYSAYCSSTGECPIVTVTAIASENPSISLRCQLWFSDGSGGMEGIFAYSKLSTPTIGKEGSFSAYLFTCENKFPESDLYGVSFVSPESSQELFLPISGMEDKVDDFSIGLCLRPPPMITNPLYSVLESIFWHSLFGVDNFYVYDPGLSGKLSRFLVSSGIRSNVTFLPWNLPHPIEETDLVTLLKTECHFRSFKKFRAFTLLNVTQLLVPKTEVSLRTEFENYIPESDKHLDVPVLKFCAEYPEVQITEFAITGLSLTMYYKPMTYSLPIVHRLHFDSASNSNSSLEISRRTLSVHDYSPCQKFDIDPKGVNTSSDTTLISKFKNDFTTKFSKYFPLKSLK